MISHCCAAALLSLAIAALAEKDCSSLGCLLLPRDVAFDNEARKALQRIRKHDHNDELVSSGNDNQVTMTMIGYKGGRLQDQINQDRAFVMSPYHVRSGNKPVPAQILGVFDGHGVKGEIVSEYALHQLPKLLAKKLEAALTESVLQDTTETDDAVKKALVETFLEVDEWTPSKEQGGCTASVVLQLGHKVYIANAGDSVSLIAAYTSQNDRAQVVYVSREDKPDLPEEYERIVKMGGTVSSPENPLEDSPRVVYTNPDTGYQVGLAMSRSIGDWNIVGVTAEPIVDVLDLRQVVANVVASVEEDPATEETCVPSEHVFVFAISATDGLMDYVQPDELADAFAHAFYRKDSPHPLTVAEDMILEAAKGWNREMEGQYRDDIAIAASKISIDDDNDKDDDKS